MTRNCILGSFSWTYKDLFKSHLNIYTDRSSYGYWLFSFFIALASSNTVSEVDDQICCRFSLLMKFQLAEFVLVRLWCYIQLPRDCGISHYQRYIGKWNIFFWSFSPILHKYLCEHVICGLSSGSMYQLQLFWTCASSYGWEKALVTLAIFICLETFLLLCLKKKHYQIP